MLGSVISAGHPAAATTVSRETNLVHRGTTHPPAPVPIRLSCPDPTHATSLAPHTHAAYQHQLCLVGHHEDIASRIHEDCDTLYDVKIVESSLQNLPSSEIHNPRRRAVGKASMMPPPTHTPLPGDAMPRYSYTDEALSP